jgi:predicted DNA-binding ribbon-helix-helix protein
MKPYNVTIGRHRTSMRLRPEMLEAIQDLCWRESITPGQLAERAIARHPGGSATAAVRVFVIDYFRAAATPRGHALAGHGALKTYVP